MRSLHWKKSARTAIVKGSVRCHKCSTICPSATEYLEHRCAQVTVSPSAVRSFIRKVKVTGDAKVIMGNQATILIRTDSLHEIEQNAQEFVDNMLLAIAAVAAGAAPKDFSVSGHGNPAQVVNFHHNDTTSVVVLGGGGRGEQLAQLYNHGCWADKREIALQVIRELAVKFKLKTQDIPANELYSGHPREI